MRAPLSLLIGCSVTLFASCSTQTRSVHYSPPSAAPVRDKISSAQGHAAKAKKAVADAQAAVRKLGILPGSDGSASSLSSSLASANQEIDALTIELLSTQTALKDFELKVSDQTNAANRAIDEKNAAITERDRQAAKVRAIAKRERFFFLAMSGALIWIFRVPLWALLKIVIGLASKLIAI